MKLATLRDSTRDGKLVVVSKDLTQCSEVGHIARNLQAALDDWAHAGPRLARVAEGIETGSQPTMRFHEHDAVAPLPRAFGRMQSWGQAVVQARSSGFAGPRDSVTLPAAGGTLAADLGLAAITGDLIAGAEGKDAGSSILLLMLYADLSPAAGEANQPWAISSFSPVAISPDELGDDWKHGWISLPLKRTLNNKPVTDAKAAGEKPSLVHLATLAAATRGLTTGTIVSASVPGQDPVTVTSGDAVRFEMKDAAGHSIFGAIEHGLVSG